MKFVQRDLGEAAEASSGGGGKGMTRDILTLSGAMLALLRAPPETCCGIRAQRKFPLARR
ncbi:MAG: hypothetical protein ACI957_003822 [Verrucomicrobiales bacterium]|jgi:hypothetical protein